MEPFVATRASPQGCGSPVSPGRPHDAIVVCDPERRRELRAPSRLQGRKGASEADAMIYRPTKRRLVKTTTSLRAREEDVKPLT